MPIAIKLGIGDFSTTRDFRPVAFALATVAIAVAWFAALAIAAVTSAWRSAAFTNEVADALPATSSRAGGATERRRADGQQPGTSTSALTRAPHS